MDTVERDESESQADQCRSETLYSVPVQWIPSLAGFKDILAVSNSTSLPKEAGTPSTADNQSSRRKPMPHWQLFDVDIKSAELDDIKSVGLDSTSTQQIHNDRDTYAFADGLSAPCCSHDLNMPPLTTEDANFDKKKSQFAPFTPDKTKRSDKQKIDAEQFSANLNRNLKNKGNEVTGTLSNATELECDSAPKVGKNSPFTTRSAPSKETDKETFDGIDPNKTPAKKARRKKHRPKVINEVKPRTRKTPKPTTSKDSTKPKRKYVRKKGLDKATSVKVNAGSTIQNIMEGTNSSCKKVLDFDIEGEQLENGAQKTPDPTTSKDSTNPKRKYVRKKGLEKGTPNKVSAGSTAENMMRVTNSSCKKVLIFDIEGEQMENGATPKEPSSLPGSLATPTKTTCPPKLVSAEFQEGRTNLRAQVGADARTGMWTETAQAKRSKRKHPRSSEKVSGSININDAHSKSTTAYRTSVYLVPFPDIHKKRRTENICHTTDSTSSTTGIINIVELGTTIIQNVDKTNLISNASKCNFEQRQVGSGLTEPNRTHPYRKHSTQEILAANHPKRRTFTAQDQNNFPSKTAEHSPRQIYANDATPTDCVDALATRKKIDDLQRHYSCVEALAAETATLTRKRTKMTSVVNSGYLRTEESPAQIFIYDPSSSPKDICNDMLIKQLQHLDINREIQLDQPEDAVIPYSKQNALVLYKREGKMVPYEGSYNPGKKRHPRPKVELDEETNRVWKLLLEDINSQGIDGTNKENIKRWEEEREVFRKRANSFIARMRLVQGDRHFSPWKGSVVDSVVGVFLTQNVTDHVSSSAFMALAARFPRTLEEATSTVTDKTDLSLFDTEDFHKCKETTSNKPFCDRRNTTLNSVETDKESKAVNNSESSRSITGERKAAEDTASSQHSVDTTNPQTGGNTGLCSKNSQGKNATNRLNSTNSNSRTSFKELLQIQGTPLHMEGFTMPNDVYSHQSTKVLPKVPNAVPNHTQGTVDNTHRHQNEIFNLYKSITKKNIDTSSNYQLLQNTKPGFVFQRRDVTINRESVAFMNNDEVANSMHNKHAAKVGAASYSAVPDIMSKTSVHEAPEFSVWPPDKGTFCFSKSWHGDSSRVSAEFTSRKQGDSLQQHENLAYRSCNMGDATETTSTFGNPSSREQKTADPNINLHASKITSGGTTISRSKQEAKRKIDAFDWDSLRREVESVGKRKRTDATIDSLDWEAVRTAQVHEIAETIKERGMNYVLAERIKAFLNRLVEEHGSIDLEWLRDVPPDKAKEYLLSIRGLGLKSAECVRLLTLHHLAFPVDTNIGRIAVRLGWVPLQPLPELLQIHLLELYPMLESIQKYLWPRLCKLDQKTLYELHYQLITFGKVFCTKTKPNCNACPMRGECRHFASAFASARLALPAPEGRRVNVTENGAGCQNPAANNHIPLSLPPRSELLRDICQLEKISGPSSIEPIIEVPGTPEPEDGQALETDIEDAIRTDSKGIPTVEMEDFKQNSQIHLDGEMSKALVVLTPESASIPNPKLKNVSRLRTEHQVYELPDSHPLLSHLDKREPDDPCSYLLAIWRPGETAICTEPPQKTCNSQGPDSLCDDIKCFSCNSIREAISQTVRGTILVPCRTAMKGSFPLNGTYFQVNEVFADHESSYSPIIVPRDWLWNLPRRTVYFGTSVSSIFKGLDTGDIQHCFWRGYVCVRGFEQKTRAPRPLALRFHCSPSQQQGKDKVADGGQPPKSKISKH